MGGSLAENAPQGQSSGGTAAALEPVAVEVRGAPRALNPHSLRAMKAASIFQPRSPEQMSATKPATKPARPQFSSGPCAKRPGWSLEALANAALGRSHRAKVGKEKLAAVIERSKSVLG